MADPRIEEGSVDKRVARLSPLMKAISRAQQGEKVNFCPFGCEMDDIDEHGYCRHLVGFTVQKKLMEPMIRDERGNRVVRVKMVIAGNGKPKPQYEQVLPTDKLVQISTSYRVYRQNVPEEMTQDEILERELAKEEAEKELLVADKP